MCPLQSKHPKHLTDIARVVLPSIPLLPGADKHPLARLGFAIPRHVQVRDVALASHRRWQQPQKGPVAKHRGWRRWLRPDVGGWAFVVTKRCGGRRCVMVGIAEAYRGGASGALVELLTASRRSPPPPLRQHRGWRRPAAVVRLGAWVVVAIDASGMGDANVGAASPSIPRCEAQGNGGAGCDRPRADGRWLACGKSRPCG
jgi:hypothetical protein